LSRVVCFIRIRSWRSSCVLIGPLVPIDASEMPLEVETRLEEEGLGVLAEQKLAPEFFRVFAMFVKVMDLGLEEGSKEELC
jgi:hypothetical protein